MDQYWYLVIINESTAVLCPTAFMNPDLSAAAALTSTSLEHHHCIYGARVRVLLLEGWFKQSLDGTGKLSFVKLFYIFMCGIISLLDGNET